MDSAGGVAAASIGVGMADQAQFELLIRALMSEKNDERKAAEAQFEALIRTPPQAAPLMCTAMAASGDHTVRSMTTVMFRKRVDATFFAALDPGTQVRRCEEKRARARRSGAQRRRAAPRVARAQCS